MLKQFYDEMVEPQHEKSWLLIIGSYFLYFIIIIFLMFVVYPNDWLKPIEFATEGLINTTLIASWGIILIIIVGLVLIIGKIKLKEVGVKIEKLPIGIISFFGFYIILNIVLLIINVAVNNTEIWHPYWLDITPTGITWAVGNLLAQIFGNVLLEELFFRGFLWIQISKKFYEITANKSWGINLGAVVSNFLFSLLHVPRLLALGTHGLEMGITLLIVFSIGILLTSVYFITENIYIAMVVHIFNNVSFALFYPIYHTNLLVIYIAVAGLIIWGFITHQMRRKGHKSIEKMV